MTCIIIDGCSDAAAALAVVLIEHERNIVVCQDDVDYYTIRSRLLDVDHFKPVIIKTAVPQPDNVQVITIVTSIRAVVWGTYRCRDPTGLVSENVISDRYRLYVGIFLHYTKRCVYLPLSIQQQEG